MELDQSAEVAKVRLAANQEGDRSDQEPRAPEYHPLHSCLAQQGEERGRVHHGDHQRHSARLPEAKQDHEAARHQRLVPVDTEGPGLPARAETTDPPQGPEVRQYLHQLELWRDKNRRSRPLHSDEPLVYELGTGHPRVHGPRAL